MKIWIFGDSHQGLYAERQGVITQHLGAVTMHRVGRDGTSMISAQGLIQDGDAIGLVFGEIDVRVHLAPQRDIAGRDPEEVISVLTEAYIRSVKSLQSTYPASRIYIFSVVPPSGFNYPGFDKSFPRNGSDLDRSMWTRDLNEKLEAASAVAGFAFVDQYTPFVNAEELLSTEVTDDGVHVRRDLANRVNFEITVAEPASARRFPGRSQSSTPVVLSTLRMLRPYKLERLRKVRLGRYYDGGYVMVDDFEGSLAAYSLGINDDASWDLDMASLGIPVFQYDHSIEKLPDTHPLFTWKRVGISGVANSAGWETLETAIRSNGHGRESALVLKCDIEGAEWELFANTSSAALRQFSQMVVELHTLDNLEELSFANLARRALRNLTTHHRVVHVHGNNWGSWGVAGGIPIPEALEITLLRSDRGVSTFSDETFPTPLDMPNNPECADLYLGRFCFE